MQRKWALVKYYQKSKWLIESKNIKIVRLIRDYKRTSMQGNFNFNKLKNLNKNA